MLLLVAVVGGYFSSPGVAIVSPASQGVAIDSPSRVSLATSRGSFDPFDLVVFLPTSVSATTSVSASVAFLILNIPAQKPYNLLQQMSKSP